MLKIAICDDEKVFRDNINKYVAAYLNEKEISYEIDTFSSGKEIIDLGIEIKQYNIIFLDINMDDVDGIVTAQKIREYSSEIYIVFVTAYINYSLEGYKVEAIRYLLKNNTNLEASISECMDAILHKMNLVVKKKKFKFNSISENYEIQKKKSHEFKNHILCIESLLKAHEYDKASKYVRNISDTFIGEKNVINTNHVIINAILNTKYQEAISKNIVFVFKVNDLSKIVIEDEDLVVILANLLNNAIEACEKCEEKKTIKLKFVIEENLIVLSVKNTCSHPIIYSDNEIKTSKKDEPEMHGIGIKNIIQIIEKYNGEYVIKNENNEFSFSIIIPL